MKLKDWLAKKKIDPQEFARILGCHHSQVYRWISGKSRPAWGTIDAIKRETKDAVTAEDFGE